MNIIIAAIGRLKGTELALYEQYTKRLAWKITPHEFDIKKTLSPETRKAEEAKLLLSACKNADRIIALDEKGKEFSSTEFAGYLQKCQIEGTSRAAFIIGGADGLDESIRKQADLLLSFGRLTWPHLLVRGLLAEQFYRAHSIISGHPYHRE